MNYGKFQSAIDYTQSFLNADDFAHTCRVLGYALQILAAEKKADATVVILAAILHDISRDAHNSTDHAQAGSEKSYTFLVENGYTDKLARQVADCILTHSTSSKTQPQTLEAKILFDADKLDTTGAVGAARAAIQCRHDGKPMYTLGEDGFPDNKRESASLLGKYRRKLKKLKKIFFTEKAKKIAAKNQPAMDEYFKGFEEEIDRNYKEGSKLIQKYCK